SATGWQGAHQRAGRTAPRTGTDAQRAQPVRRCRCGRRGNGASGSPRSRGDFAGPPHRRAPRPTPHRQSAGRPRRLRRGDAGRGRGYRPGSGQHAADAAHRWRRGGPRRPPSGGPATVAAGRRGVKLLGGLVVAALCIIVFPDTAWAWTPGTHVVLGERILGSLNLLVPAAADLLRAFPYDFLYGSIAADTTMAKK